MRFTRGGKSRLAKRKMKTAGVRRTPSVPLRHGLLNRVTFYRLMEEAGYGSRNYLDAVDRTGRDVGRGVTAAVVVGTSVFTGGGTAAVFAGGVGGLTAEVAIRGEEMDNEELAVRAAEIGVSTTFAALSSATEGLRLWQRLVAEAGLSATEELTTQALAAAIRGGDLPDDLLFDVLRAVGSTTASVLIEAGLDSQRGFSEAELRELGFGGVRFDGSYSGVGQSVVAGMAGDGTALGMDWMRDPDSASGVDLLLNATRCGFAGYGGEVAREHRGARDLPGGAARSPGDEEAAEGDAVEAQELTPLQRVRAEASSLRDAGRLTHADWAMVYSLSDPDQARRLLDERYRSHADAVAEGGDYETVAAALERDGIIDGGTTARIGDAADDHARQVLLDGALDRAERTERFEAFPEALARFEEQVAGDATVEWALIEFRTGGFGVMRGEGRAIPNDPVVARIRMHSHPTTDGTYDGLSAMPSLTVGDLGVGFAESARTGRPYAQTVVLSTGEGLVWIPLFADAAHQTAWFEVPTADGQRIRAHFEGGEWLVRRGDFSLRSRDEAEVYEVVRGMWENAAEQVPPLP